MDRADRSGLGVAIVGHALLFAALTLTIARRQPPVHAVPEAMDVQLVDAVGLRSAAPAPATEAPRQSEAPALGPPVPAPPPAAAPKPSPTIAPAPTSSPAPIKAAPSKPAPRLSSDFLKDLPSAQPARKATGARLGADFLKGLPGASPGKSDAPRAAVTGAAMNGLAAAIFRQVKPCYNLGALGGTPATQITTVLDLRFNRDGSVAGTPQVVEQTGVQSANSAYKQQMIDVSRRAVLQCAPLQLPAELYEGGWEHLQLNFIPGQMR